MLRGLEITRPNQVWAIDITYIPMAKGFVYLAGVLDWFSRRDLSWRLSITMEASFCVETLEDALGKHGKPEIFNTARLAVHVAGFLRRAAQARHQDQHGQQGRVAGQCVSGRPTTPTSATRTRGRSAWRPNPGGRCTYPSGKLVRISGATSLTELPEANEGVIW